MEVLRIEEKYLIPHKECRCYKDMIARVFPYEKFSSKGRYNVRTLYFSTMKNIEIKDNKEADIESNIRLRIYSSDDTWAKIELKQKQNMHYKKRSLCISKLDAMQLIEGNYYVLLHYGSEFAQELHRIMSTECYKPTCITEHKREVFVEKERNIRMTFDSEVRSTESCYDLFSEELVLRPEKDDSKVVCEVKYEN